MLRSDAHIIQKLSCPPRAKPRLARGPPSWSGLGLYGLADPLTFLHLCLPPQYTHPPSAELLYLLLQESQRSPPQLSKILAVHLPSPWKDFGFPLKSIHSARFVRQSQSNFRSMVLLEEFHGSMIALSSGIPQRPSVLARAVAVRSCPGIKQELQHVEVTMVRCLLER